MVRIRIRQPAERRAVAAHGRQDSATGPGEMNHLDWVISPGRGDSFADPSCATAAHPVVTPATNGFWFQDHRAESGGRRRGHPGGPVRHLLKDLELANLPGATLADVADAWPHPRPMNRQPNPRNSIDSTDTMHWSLGIGFVVGLAAWQLIPRDRQQSETAGEPPDVHTSIQAHLSTSLQEGGGLSIPRYG